MAFDCDKTRTNLARQTPVYDEKFLDDFISVMVNEPFMGRHKTETWADGKDTITYDKMHVPQPDYLSDWQRINGEECGDACNPPRTYVGVGTTRDSAFMEQKVLQSQLFCLTQLRTVPHVGQQIAAWYKILRAMPQAFMGDFLRTRFTSYHDTLQIAGAAGTEFAITTANTSVNLSNINLGSAAALPTSQLTLAYLSYLSQQLGMKGYDEMSGLPAGMRNLVTHSRTYQGLVGMNPELRSQIYPQAIGDLSPLYKVGKGINADPFGFLAPTFDEKQIRFQHVGDGLLARVLPYLNTAATTGNKPIVNPGWLNARYALSYILHPQAAILYTPAPKKIHDMVPSVNSAMFGKWSFKNGDVLIYENPDGTICTEQNDQNNKFYWLASLAAGFRYDQRDLVMPILHLSDGAGRDCLVDSPVCGDEPQYDAQYQYTDGGMILCEVE